MRAPSPAMCELLGLPSGVSDIELVPLIVSLREAIARMSEVDVTGIEPSSEASEPRGWASVEF